ncbi:hypothetical protein ACPXCE_29015 [Streptomyces sp. DT24]|uniref:hypothetical protein n=1 Tax=Streptomyces sp. DT24 TaxID=3416520 RepID=UPI003CE68DB8
MAGRKRGATCGRLLLFAALLLGVFTMHTVGHPAGHGDADPSAAVVTVEHAPPGLVSSGTAHAMSGAGAADDAMPGADMAAPVSGAGAADGQGASEVLSPFSPSGAEQVSGHLPMSGTDPMAVCLAVLSTWGAALLVIRLVAARRRSGDRPSPQGVGAKLCRALWPDSPPHRTDLTELSVLRV